MEMLFQRLNQLGNTSSAVDEGEYVAEVTYTAAGLISVVTYYTTSLKNEIVKKETYGYTSSMITSITETNYTNGKPVQTIVYPITYASNLVSTVGREIS
jgi:hypothetical protein